MISGPEREKAWAKCLRELGLDALSFVSQSRWDPWRRTYAADGRIYKISLTPKHSATVQRAQSLSAECEILKRCSGIPGIPMPVAYRSTREFEALALEHLPGEPLAITTVSLTAFLRVLWRLGVILLRVCRRGISHNDIQPDNVLLAANGAVFLLDFDQASQHSFLGALARSFADIGVGDVMVWGSFWTVPKAYLRRRLPPRVATWVRRALGRGTTRAQMPALPEDAPHQLKELLKAWQLARISDANAPGTGLAYYSLEVDGYSFPGERPWLERWSLLQGLTDYQGKRILELGCNMGLLSSFFLKEMGATAAMAVDADETILRAAQHVANALGVRPTLVQQDFDACDTWEERLADFRPDIVFALSVLNWVRDKRRFMAFLGHFREVIFEGHETAAIEARRFRDVGLQWIEMVGVSERGRPILHCRKRAPEPSAIG